MRKIVIEENEDGTAWVHNYESEISYEFSSYEEAMQCASDCE